MSLCTYSSIHFHVESSKFPWEAGFGSPGMVRKSDQESFSPAVLDG